MPFVDRPHHRRVARPRLAPSLLCLALATAWSAPGSAQLVVSNGQGPTEGLTFFPANATGNATPLRVVTGSQTQMRVPGQFVIDPVHQEILVASALTGDMYVFPLNASGDVPPIRYLHPGLVESVALDLAHDELFGTSEANNIAVYPRTASGNATPLRTIAGSATQLSIPSSVAYDAMHGEIFVTSQGNSRVLVFRRTDHGNVAPLRVLEGPHTQLMEPYGVAVDVVHDEIIVTDRVGAISAFARTAHGDTAPLRHVAGANSTLKETLGVTLLSDTELAVASLGETGSNLSDDRVLVFSRTANGNAPPLRKIGGSSSSTAGPFYAGVISMVLNDSRFFVEATWRTPDKTRGIATAQKITGDTGYLWFFSDQNVEAVVKVLDGCANNGKFWVFAGGLTNVFTSLKVTDLATGQAKVYTNPLNTAFQPIQDTAAFATCGTSWTAPAAAPLPPAVRADIEPSTTTPTFSCTGLCLSSNRYRVSATWHTASASGTATGVKLTDDTGYLWFFGASNVEVVVKVLNGCLENNHVWVFAGGLTNVQVTLTVHDSLTGKDAVYVNPQGTAFKPVQDTGAFQVCI
ncbi:MAG: hypothetical protein ABI609_11385 [Acidobacteriota bacterium]